MRSSATQSESSAATALRDAVMTLQRARIETASLDARVLLSHALGISREQLLLELDHALSPQQLAAFNDLVSKRTHRQPVSQLVGRREFWGMNFTVTPSVLDPRPDSETLIEAALSRFDDRDAPLKILDLGTGTGCLLLALLKEFRHAKGLGVDMSADALSVAEENVSRLGFQTRARFLLSNWCQQVKGRFDIIISNPPYIPTAAVQALEPEVSKYEPRLALDGGEDGLDCYRNIIPAVSPLLERDGVAIFEVGEGQHQPVQDIVREHGLQVAAVRQDMQGIMRCIIVKHLTKSSM